VSFVAELKQRKVFRVAMVYLVVAWVAIQAASIALPAFDAPAWALRVLILLFALGLPLALVLAWVLELTPEGPKLTAGKIGNRRMAWLSIGLAALALAWFFYGQPALRSRDVVLAQDRSIAVLPFVNMSGDPANDYFSDGLAETTLDMLAQVQNLKVIARTSSFAFKGKDIDMREIGKALGAAHLLEGSVQQAGDTVRVTVQLIRAADGSHLWSRHFDRRMSDVFKIQDEVATAVVDALQVALTRPEQRRLVQKRTDNVAAYQEYLKGIALLPERNVPDMRKAVQHFERAIQLDPGYARAYAAAHDAYYLLDQYGSISDADRARADRHLARALALGPDLGEVHVAHAAALERATELPAAEAEYRRGLQLAPGYATGYQWYGEFLANNYGRFDEALRLLEKATALDPLSPVIGDVMIFTLGQSGRLDEAMALSDRVIAEHPDIARNFNGRAALYHQRGDLVGALRSFGKMQELDPEGIGFQTFRCQTLIDFSAIPDARACMDAMARRGAGGIPFGLFTVFRLQLIEGNAKAAMATLDRVQPPPPYVQAWLLVQSGQTAQALESYRRLAPAWLVAPQRPPYPGEAWDALNAGVALVRTGSQAQGRALLQAAIDALGGRPYAAVVAGRTWDVAIAYAQLGDMDRAFAEMQTAVDAGYFLGIADLDAQPLAAALRADPRYAKILAPARARAAAQVDAARAAGLL
jgi:TolB-like protein